MCYCYSIAGMRLGKSYRSNIWFIVCVFNDKITLLANYNEKFPSYSFFILLSSLGSSQKHLTWFNAQIMLPPLLPWLSHMQDLLEQTGILTRKKHLVFFVL